MTKYIKAKGSISKFNIGTEWGYLESSITDDLMITEGDFPEEKSSFEASIKISKDIEDKVGMLRAVVLSEFDDLRAEMRGMSVVRQMNLEIMNYDYSIPIWVEKEGDVYVASAPDINLASQGCTPIAAFQNLRELTLLYFEDENKDYVKKTLKPFKIK